MKEKRLSPPLSLLRWLVDNRPPNLRTPTSETERLRAALFARGSEYDQALAKLADGNVRLRFPKWYLLEGQSCPDVYIETDAAIVVIEGKRTETGPGTRTSSMKVRLQMHRHIEGALEENRRKNQSKRVYGFYIVEGNGGSEATEVPRRWMRAAMKTIDAKTLEQSLPHLSPEDRAAVGSCFLGVTTWQAVCQQFGIDFDELADLTVPVGPEIAVASVV